MRENLTLKLTGIIGPCIFVSMLGVTNLLGYSVGYGNGYKGNAYETFFQEDLPLNSFKMVAMGLGYSTGYLSGVEDRVERELAKSE